MGLVYVLFWTHKSLSKRSCLWFDKEGGITITLLSVWRIKCLDFGNKVIGIKYIYIYKRYNNTIYSKNIYSLVKPLVKRSLSDDILRNGHGWTPPRHQHRTRCTSDKYRIKPRRTVAPPPVTGRSIFKQHEEGFERDFN